MATTTHRSRGHTVGATLMNVHLTGSDLMTGGAFGIENNLAMTLVAVAADVPVAA